MLSTGKIYAVITNEDYQQNLDVIHSENPTSMAYSSNKTTVALFPICVEFLLDGVIQKGAVVFLSDDKDHDAQQATGFEQRMFQIICNKIPHPILHWQRWSDGCGEQFHSQFCNTECSRANKRFGLQSTTWSTFEAADDVNLLSILPESTEKFKFFVIENFPEIERVPAKDRTGLPVKDILKMHNIQNIGNGLLIQKLACTECTIAVGCQPCSKLIHNYLPTFRLLWCNYVADTQLPSHFQTNLV